MIANLLQWNTNGFATPGAAITRLLRGPDNQTGNATRDADNGSLENLGIPRSPARLGLNNLPGVGYEARVFDEDDSGRGLTLTAADRSSIGEDGNATNDANTRILVRSIGYATDGTQLTLEATISPVTLPAILTDGDLRLNGNITMAGAAGGVHTNDDLDLNGTSIAIARDATATGAYTVSGNPVIGGVSGGGTATIPIAPIRASDYLNRADYILNSDGRLTNQAGAVLCNASANPNACQAVYGWTYNGPGWSVNGNGNGYAVGTYYVRGPVDIGGSPGSNANPWQISIIAEGSIDISGSPDFRADDANVLFVTDGDLEINGNFTQWGGESSILVHEQFDFGGNITLIGQVTAEDGANASNLVTSNRLHGSVNVTYNALNGGQTFTIGAWREVR